MPATPEVRAIEERLYEIRRAHLRRLRANYRTITEFAKALGERMSYVQRLLSDNMKGRKNLGEGKARQFEVELGLPHGSLDDGTNVPVGAPAPTEVWPHNFPRAIWDNLSRAEQRKASAMLLTLINGIEAERGDKEDTG